ncbi:MAG: DUF2911 domain-containing protein [Bacteroidota bacterium]
MRSLSLLFGLAMLLVLSGCASEDSPADSAETTAEAAAADGAERADGDCETSRPAEIASPGACAATTLGGARLVVDYGSPGVKGREIFGGLEPYGEVWRTGANEATTFTTSEDLLVNGDSLAAGTYALFTIPRETEWTVIFNSVAEQWGAFEYDESADVLRVTATPAATDALIERFTISFEEAADSRAVMTLAWANTRVPVSITTAG